MTVYNVKYTAPYYYNEESLQSVTDVQNANSAKYGYPPFSSYNNGATYKLNNDNPTYVGGFWVSQVVNGETVFVVTLAPGQPSPLTVKLPVNIINPRQVTITAGTVVDGVVMVGGSGSTNTLPSVTVNGTLQNSFVANMLYKDSIQGLSQGNVYLQSASSILVGTSKQDLFWLSTTGGADAGVIDLSGLTTLPSSVTPQTRDLVTITAGAAIGTNGHFNSYIGGWNAFTTFGNAVLGCFLAGSMIETVNGFIAVEDVQVGDKVITYQNGQKETRSIIWTGHNTAQVRTHLSDDAAGYPVRILKDAITDGVPCKDMLITPEHSILVDDQFIPVRMLVNGATIFYDHSITEYVFYHIETENHSIINVDNVLTESYLDTGNRSYFISGHNIQSITNKQKEWNKDSAAPLVTNREIVEPIYMQFVERAEQLGKECILPNLLTTNDSGLHLVTEDGEILEPTYQKNGRFIFKLPGNVAQVRLVSRTARPSQVVGPYLDDRRDLGVLVSDVTLLEQNTAHPITEHLTSVNLQGWYVEGQQSVTCRWTNGDAVLTIRSEKNDNIGMLTINVLAAGPYIVKEKITPEQQIA